MKHMSKSEERNILKSYYDNLTNDQRAKILKEVMGPPRRELVGDEYNHIWLLLKLKGPSSESNNQHTITEIYHLSDKTYHVTYGFGHNPIIEEIG